MLANGRSYLAIPGPSVMPDAVLQAMHRSAPNIYTGALHDLTHSLIPDLKKVARTEGEVAIYIGNGHAAWEAALANVLSRGDRILVLVTGRFGHGWARMAAGLGVGCEVVDFGERSDIDLARVEEALRADSGHTYKAVLVTHVDTSTGVRNDVAGVRAVLDATGHPGLLMVDCIASFACDRFEMDAWGADVAVAASQKGLMTPPGLGFVYFNDRANAARDHADLATEYWDWRPRIRPEIYSEYFDGTAPTHHLYGLRTALDMILAEGMEAVWARHEALAQCLWEASEIWASDGPLELNIADRSKRSHAITSFAMEEGQADRLRDWCEHKTGVTLGIGVGRQPASAFFRVGHMGHVNAHMMLGVIAVIDAGLKALDIAHGANAVEAATRHVARVVGA
ncbi:alanine--glyoxylate aminotransferase family protein [Ponticoccus sp. SC2-23]|uniref:pyridoxal-phosphate-dependent aminotransferase family protein n=1 Tax=Alexandriicola marinus TaxID=2081710 RepID=UPI000FD7CAAF|nr:aminotransferase class V-fold PLP-dependent enzyme [Alexandriicola marinus]MBM1221633.1 alanine--glyoxylate aminotransferase family protein [Ponticoccus sp. SC6-9]MBM1226674.1 alanine--glyoxylate aminotransferase family protein [Ponticoccus sp. SC6-15]MBM1230625.1 alanine--glyoxylate aminotransferase family protein [Ponticoccus sp. SC6-38]MBM1235148.1 alanine--glyoxylate aminotransferase family protein [Ponticoccus sp. SC6-45]MBM1239646.1 alanine--glyoxylate aminotransferase family protein 